jgi:hypothetical protein
MYGTFFQRTVMKLSMLVDLLPDFPLQPHSELAREFLALGLSSYHEAARYVQNLPYGRNSNRADFYLVLREKHGTCSTKHALLAQLAREHDADVTLTLGMYEMNEKNTAGTGSILRHYRLDSLPEAHCYLMYNGLRFDLTRRVGATEQNVDFLIEETILPEQIGEYKVEQHRVFLRQWCVAIGLDFNLAWKIREECIAALTTAARAE